VSSSGTDAAGKVDVVMPQMGVSVSEGTIAAWLKEVGDDVAYEEPICEISTDKIDVEVPAIAAGTLAEIVVPAGEAVAVGTVLARISSAEAPAGAVPGATANGAAADREAEAAPPPARAEAGPRRYSPVVTRMAADRGIDLEQVPGNGRGGRVTKKDLLAFLAAGEEPRPASTLHGESPYREEPRAGAAQPQPPAGAYVPPEPRRLSRMRAAIGANMKRSQEQTATCTNWMEVDMTGVERARRAAGLTAMPLIAEAVTATLREHPALNAWLEDDRHTLHEDVNLGIAVSLGDDGLLVPVILGAQRLSVDGLAAAIRDLAARARERRLSPDELAGGTFTISNAGRHGSLMATPIINQPQVAILGVETIEKRAVAVIGPGGEDAIAVRTMTTLGLSWDHRALDGVAAAEFLATLKRRLEAVGS
jgi:pyruvate/2-oxoglutarate dehydrogenase complex dihydrolipoamide acyltransferase (E2) component